MSRIKKLMNLLLVGVFSISLFLATGCSRHPNTEQIQKMEEARSACLSAETKLNETRKQREDLEAKLAQKKAELENLQKEKEMIQQRLNNWSTQE